MNTYIIAYDLNRPGQKYKRLYKAIKFYQKAERMASSVWKIKTTRTIAKIKNHLRSYLDQNDKLYIAKVIR